MTDASGHSDEDASGLLDLAAEIVAAFVSNNSLSVSELPGLIGQVHSALVGLSGTGSVTAAAAVSLQSAPAVPIKKSVTDGYIVCLEDGHKFKSLKRHLRASHTLTPDTYREKWHLPHDYPMVAPAYAKARSSLAKSYGLGQKRRTYKKKSG
jgi:predicted transcriptional regulator